jgi:hypothetical protein
MSECVTVLINTFKHGNASAASQHAAVLTLLDLLPCK